MANRGAPLSEADWQAAFSPDGRLVDEAKLRSKIFKGGVDASIRRDVWYFLLGYYPMHSTSLERSVLQKERRMDYLALKARWKEELLDDMSGEGDDEDLDVADTLPPEDQFVFIQAKLTAMRYDIDHEKAQDSMRIVKKDVPRTDRQHEYFEKDDSEHLVWLHDILVTYAVFHQEVGYVQGMNDVLAIILFVIDNEADAYWCLNSYLNLIQSDFMAKGMVEKIESLKRLLNFIEPDLMQHLEKIDAGDLIFCHRWLLLGFKREFVWDDSVRLFEILCSHHMELNSVQADKVRSTELRKERMAQLSASDVDPTTAPTSKGKGKAEPAKAEGSLDELDFSFELFVCCAIFRQHREKIMACTDLADVFTVVNSLVEKMDLDHIISDSEDVFYEYCRRSITASAGATAALLRPSTST